MTKRSLTAKRSAAARRDVPVTIAPLGSVEVYCLLIGERLTIDEGEVTRRVIVDFAAKECGVEISGESVSHAMTRLASLGYLQLVLDDPTDHAILGKDRRPRRGRPTRRYEVTEEGRATAFDAREKWTKLLSTTYPYPVE